jgi:TonB-dependent SusC/RagA subfamily outer membrane receptor
VRLAAAVLLMVPSNTPLQAQHRIAANAAADRSTPLDRPARLTVEDTPLGAALKRLHRSSGVDLVFSPSNMPPNHRVSCSCELFTVREALETMLLETNLVFREVSGQVVIVRKPEVPALPPPPSGEFEFDEPAGGTPRPFEIDVDSISGRVVHSQTRHPLDAARITVEGTDVQAVTDGNGAFKVRGTLPAGQVTLVVARIGFRPATVRVAAGTTDVVVALQPSPVTLDEVVVTGTAGAQTARSIGNAVSIIKTDEVVRISPPRDMQSLLSTQVPGLHVTSAGGAVGSGGNTRIRGVSSLILGAEPLVYVDGVRVNSSDIDSRVLVPGAQIGIAREEQASRLNDFNPEDIESIEVIKGPAAATLYGTEASNGVIQIITKRGRAGRPRVDFNIRQGALWLPDANGNAFPHVFYQKGGRGSGGEIVEVNLLQEDLKRGFPSWFRTGHTQSYGASASGGSEVMQFYISGDFDRDEGIVSYNWKNQLTGRANITYTPSSAFDLKFNLGYLRSRVSGASSQQALSQTIMYGCQSPGCEPGAGQPFDLNGRTRGYYRVLPEVNESDFEGFQDVDRTTLGIQARHTPFKWLTHRLSVGGDFGTANNSSLYRATGNLANLRNFGFKDDQDIQSNFVNFDYGATGTFGLFKHLSLATSTGAQFIRKAEHVVYASGQNFPVETVETLNSGTLFTAQEAITENRTFGLYVQEQVSWKNRIFVTGALRGDDNSAFGSQFDFQMYPKLSASWVISDEPFLSGGKIVNSLKLRGAWGKAGQQPDVFAAIRTFIPRGGPNGAPTLTPSGFGNPGLKPEVGSELEFGFDAGLINDRVGLEFTWFDKRRKNAIIAVPALPSLGFPGTVFQNIGEVKAHGVELGLNASVLNSDNVGLDLFFTYSTSKNKVLEMGALPSMAQLNQPAGGQHSVAGLPIASWFLRRVVSADVANGVATNVMCEGGELIPGTNFSRGGGAPVPCATAPQVYWGQPIPEYEGTLSATLRLGKNLQLYGAMDFVGGHHKWYSEVTQAHALWFNSRATLERTDPIFTGYMSLAALGSIQTGFADAGFGKFRTLSATYTFPRRWARALGADQASVSLAGENIADLWGETHIFGHQILELEQTMISGGTNPGLTGFTQGNGWPQNSRLIMTFRVAY